MKRILIDHHAMDLEGTRTLLDLLQTEGIKEATRRIIVLSKDRQRGEVILTDGLVYGVITDNAEDHVALTEILNWEIVEIQVEPSVPAGLGLVSDCYPVDQLLLEIADRIPTLQRNKEGMRKESSSMVTIEEKIRGVLARMVDRLGGLEGAMLVDSEGFIAASYGTHIGSSHDVEMIGGIATSVLSMTSKMAAELRIGGVDRIMIHGHERHVFVSTAGPDMNLVTVARRDASLGLIFAELNRMGRKISDTLRGD